MKIENRFYIRILSPIHLGCDEVYDPTGFVVDENAGTLTAFDPLDFFRNLGLQDKVRYADICRKGTIESIIELYKFMRGKQFRGHSVEICDGLVAQYQKTLVISANDRRKIQQELNNFSISRTSFSPTTQKPFIPGSAIKGVLRTAYLNHLAKDRCVSYDRKAGDILEKGLLDYQKLENDPFRLLKVSDFHPVGPFRTKIVFAVNAKKKPSEFKARGPYQILEIVEPGAIFTGTIQVLEPLSRTVITTPLTRKAIFDSASEFYRKEKNREDEELKEAGIPVLIREDKDNAVSLRLGRHSGAESVTIAGHRNIKIMKIQGDKPGYSDKATTFWLAAETSASDQETTLRPFGWAALEQMTDAMDDAFEKIRIEEEALIPSVAETPFAKIPQELPALQQPEPVEEVWDEAYVSFNAGGGGIVTATSKDEKKAELRGKDKALSATADSLHKKLFDGKKSIPKTRVVVEPVGNAYRIVSIGS
jgi:CRISPR-associated protein Csm5